MSHKIKRFRQFLNLSETHLLKNQLLRSSIRISSAQLLRLPAVFLVLCCVYELQLRVPMSSDGLLPPSGEIRLMPAKQLAEVCNGSLFE
jgi:hypothetical protein